MHRSRAHVDDEGRYTGKMQFYAFGPFKAEAMDTLAAERGIDLAASYAYTDSYTDLPMLEAVGHPVAVNPDRVLNRYAGDEFKVLHFSQTVSLWSRVRDRFGAVPPRPAIAASAGAVALGVGAAAAGWWLGSRDAAANRPAVGWPTVRTGSRHEERFAAMTPRATSSAKYHELLDHVAIEPARIPHRRHPGLRPGPEALGAPAPEVPGSDCEKVPSAGVARGMAQL